MANASIGIIEDSDLVQNAHGNWVTEYPENTIVRCPDGSVWYVNEDRDWDKLGRGSGSLRGPAEILNLPGATQAEESDGKAIDLWVAKKLLQHHNANIRDAHDARPKAGDPAANTYQETVMVPLLEEGRLLRLAVQDAERNANSGVHTVKAAHQIPGEGR